MGNSFKTETFLRELVREILESELSERSAEARAKKAARKAVGFTTQKAKQFSRGTGPGQDASTGWRGEPKGGTIPTGRTPTTMAAVKQADTAGSYVDAARAGKQSTDKLASRPGRAAFSNLKQVMQTDRNSDTPDTYMGANPDGTMKASPVPAQVQQAASKDAGGRVVFGRYYDSSGKYLGRSQGGKWVDAAGDPSAKSQMEIVKKLSELKASGNLPTNRDKLKEVVREVIRSCS